MSKTWGYIGYDAGGDLITDSYGHALLFKTPDDAKACRAYRVVTLVTAKLDRKQRSKSDEIKKERESAKIPD